jgi:hypothetical protein
MLLLPWRWLRRLLPEAAAVFFALMPPAAIAALPPVLLVEDHSDVVVSWEKTGARGAIVVNVDAVTVSEESFNSWGYPQIACKTKIDKV